MEAELLKALNRAISALNQAPNFRTADGTMSYDLIPQLERVVKNTEHLKTIKAGYRRNGVKTVADMF